MSKRYFSTLFQFNFFSGGPHPVASRLVQEEGGEEVFSPASGRSPHSSLSSPQVSVDSPRICFSPLRIKDSIEEEDETGHVIHRCDQTVEIVAQIVADYFSKIYISRYLFKNVMKLQPYLQS